jgi:hypothetical protein
MPKTHRTRWLSSIVVFLASCLVFAPSAVAAPNGYGSQPVAGWSVNGTGFAVLTVGGTTYVGGEFTHAIAPDGTRIARSNLAAFDAVTGALVTAFVADTNARVRGLATDGSRLYAVGNFTTVNGTARGRTVALDLATGAVAPTFVANLNADVYDVVVTGETVYLGGGFTTVNGVSRRRLAAVDRTTGALDPGFSVTPDAFVRSLALNAAGDRLFVGGRHTVIGGVTMPRLAAVDLVSRTVVGVPLGLLADEVFDVVVSADGTMVYAAVGGAANLVAAWNTTTGERLWFHRVDGDVQAVELAHGNLWFGFHDGAGGDTTVRLLAADALTGELLPFRPVIDSFFGVWAIDATDGHLAIAGAFRFVAGVSSRGIAHFPFVGFPPPPPPPVTLVAASSPWSYNDLGVDLGSTWIDPVYDDSAWPTGAGQLGYGDGDEATVIGWGPHPTRRAITAYFRSEFVLDDASPVVALDLDLLRDDGAVVYLNGVEILRNNMPTGVITAVTPASSATSRENEYRSFLLDPAALVDGVNVLAVEVHQDSIYSSDLSFDLVLTALLAPPA